MVVEFYNTRMRKIATKDAGHKEFEKLLNNCRSCGCGFWYDEDENIAKVQGTKENCEELMFWARLKK